MIDRGTRVIVVAAMLAGLVFAQAGRAEAQTARISYRAAELQTQDGARAVLGRMQSAAKRACAFGMSASDAAKRATCRADIVQEMVDKVDNRAVTALWTGRRDTRLASRAR